MSALLFIDKHLDLLSEERDAEIGRTSLIFSKCGPKLLEQKGLALNGLGVASIGVGLGNKTLIELERPSAYHTVTTLPPHTFRPGDLASIEENHVVPTRKSRKSIKSTDASGRDKTMPAVEGVVYKLLRCRTPSIVIAVDPSHSDLSDFELPERCRVLKLANSITYDRMEGALRQLKGMIGSPTLSEAGVPMRSRLIEVLLGLEMPSRGPTVHSMTFFDNSLNDSQKAAVMFALESVEVACIHGPPGTGKTHTLIEIIRQLTSITPVNPTALRLLICGASNLSVDNILERLLALPAPSHGPRLRVTRIGHPARVIAQEDALNATLETQADRSDQVCKSSSRRRERDVVSAVLQGSQFDVVIIDEATQALEAVCWVPIFKAKKLILAGDPKQLPPTVLSLRGHVSLDQYSPASKVDVPTSTSGNGVPLPRPNEAPGADDSENRNPSGSAIEADNVSGSRAFGPETAQGFCYRGLTPPRTLELTMFERLETNKMLTVQYRMHTKIAEFPSKTMYGSMLTTHSSVATHLLRQLPNVVVSSEEDAQEILETPVVFFDTAGCEYFERLEGDSDEGSRCNENEATIVKQWVATLVAMGVNPSQIAIITPYQAQVSLLTTLLRSTHGPELEIGTVDGMQGREKEAVIISLVRSNDKREVGFLKEERRLNVAMTRARRHLVIMCLNPKRCFILNCNSVRGRGLVHSTTRQQIFEGLADLARRECGCSLRGTGLTLAKMATPGSVLARKAG
ncbi:P-loop containing nucleoside triphosphate hydrolase protein [Lactarius hatsudake]|nr:P-loop containing nucleoside triphosphate hydrolase protein [Lactarius hatsudake]